MTVILGPDFNARFLLLNGDPEKLLYIFICNLRMKKAHFTGISRISKLRITIGRIVNDKDNNNDMDNNDYDTIMTLMMMMMMII